MRMSFGPDDEAFRAELNAFLDAHTPPEAQDGADFMGEYSGDEIVPRWLRQWQATLFDHGWMIPAYPPELGGRNCTPVQTLIYLETMAGRRIPRSVHFPGYAIVTPSLLEFGNDAQRALAPAAARGDTIWCIGMSEPNAGSDLAGLQTRAEVFDDEFVVNGQKVWTSYATDRAEVLLLRAHRPVGREAPGHLAAHHRHGHARHRGAPAHATSPARPTSPRCSSPTCGSRARTLSARSTAGWAITQGSLAHERAGLWVEGVARFEQTVDALTALARRTGRSTDPIVRRKIAETYELASSLRSLGYQGFASFAQGSSAPEHSYMKMATSEAGKAAFELGMEICGPYGAVTDELSGQEAGRWVTSFFVSFANTVAGGSSEIQRNIVAQRVLGLPRA